MHQLCAFFFIVVMIIKIITMVILRLHVLRLIYMNIGHFCKKKVVFFLTLARGVKEKETVFTLSLDSSPTDHYIKLQNYLPAGRTE